MMRGGIDSIGGVNLRPVDSISGCFGFEIKGKGT